MVASVDGKTTQGNTSVLPTWTSKEDQEYFSGLIDSAHLIIMGRKTYAIAKPQMKHTPGRLRIVVTSKPHEWNMHEAIPGQLEFTNEQPTELIKRLEQKGYTSALLVGGATLNTAFLKANLVNELILTIEPKIFGQGTSVVENEELDVNLKLTSIKTLNDQGTLLLKYRII